MMTNKGKEIALYYPNGDSIASIEEFIDFYSKCYYWTNNKEVEDLFDTILKEGIQNANDVFRILAWKFGTIKMNKSTSKELVYYKGWDERKFEAQIYKDIVNVKPLCDEVVRLTQSRGKLTAQDILDQLKSATIEIDGFYTVYIITLLYFITKGEMPIVDSFAFVAAKAILSGTPFGTRIYYDGLPSVKKDEYYTTIENSTYSKYIDMLYDLFGEEYKTNRDIDRALWSYGKLFKK